MLRFLTQPLGARFEGTQTWGSSTRKNKSEALTRRTRRSLMRSARPSATVWSTTLPRVQTTAHSRSSTTETARTPAPGQSWPPARGPWPRSWTSYRAPMSSRAHCCSCRKTRCFSMRCSAVCAPECARFPRTPRYRRGWLRHCHGCARSSPTPDLMSCSPPANSWRRAS